MYLRYYGVDFKNWGEWYDLNMVIFIVYIIIYCWKLGGVRFLGVDCYLGKSCLGDYGRKRCYCWIFDGNGKNIGVYVFGFGVD